MQIKTKLTLYFFSITASLLLLAFSLIYYVSANERSKYFHKRLVNKSITTAKLYFKITEVDPDLILLFHPDKRELLGFEDILIFDNTSTQVYRYNQKSQNKYLDENTDAIISLTKKENQITKKKHDLMIIGHIMKVKNKNYIIIASARDTYGIQFLSHLFRNLVLIYITIVSLLVISGWFFSRKALQPISKVIHEVDQLSIRDMKLRMHEDKNQKDEIALLIQTFNRMLERIDKAFTMQKVVIANISHELMNPLSIITSQIEVALLSPRTEKEYIHTLESVLEDMKKLNIISKQIINLSVYRESQDRKGFKKVRLDEIIWDVRKEFKKLNPNVTIQFNVLNLPENDELLFINANETLLKTCFMNLIDNGAKFSTNNSVKINLSIKSRDLLLSFENDGVGINEHDFKNLFSPFYRGENTSKIKGYGIGLSIVKSIVDLHNAEIEVHSLQNINTIFKLTFKKTPRI